MIPIHVVNIPNNMPATSKTECPIDRVILRVTLAIATRSSLCVGPCSRRAPLQVRVVSKSALSDWPCQNSAQPQMNDRMPRLGLGLATMAGALTSMLFAIAVVAAGADPECGMTIEALREYDGKCELADINSSFPHCGNVNSSLIPSSFASTRTHGHYRHLQHHHHHHFLLFFRCFFWFCSRTTMATIIQINLNSSLCPVMPNPRSILPVSFHYGVARLFCPLTCTRAHMYTAYVCICRHT